MPRTKQFAAPRNSSLASCYDGDNPSTKLLEYYETSTKFLDTERKLAEKKLQAGANTIIWKTQAYFSNLIKSFPDELLDKRFLEVLGEVEADPYIFEESSQTPADSVLTSVVASTRGRTAKRKAPAKSTVKKGTTKRMRPSSHDTHTRCQSLSRSSSLGLIRSHSLLGSTSRCPVTPKFDLRKGRLPVGARPAKVGEIAMSLSGSPIKPIHVSMNLGNGKVLNIEADGKRVGRKRDEDLKRLQEAVAAFISKN